MGGQAAEREVRDTATERVQGTAGNENSEDRYS